MLFRTIPQFVPPYPYNPQPKIVSYTFLLQAVFNYTVCRKPCLACVFLKLAAFCCSVILWASLSL